MIRNLICLLLLSCSTLSGPSVPTAPKEFSRGETILATQLLTKIFDQEMAPLSCVPDTAEASLLLRTIHPRMEVVQDDIEAMLDSDEEIKGLIEGCDQSCTCDYLDDLFREHQVTLSKQLRATMDKKKKIKSLSACLNYVKETFCSSELYLELNKEKGDFSYDEAAP